MSTSKTGLIVLIVICLLSSNANADDDVDTVYIDTSFEDGYVWSQGPELPPPTTWEDICAGTGGTQLANVVAATAFIGRRFKAVGSIYYFYEALLLFRLPEIDGTITGVRLFFYVWVKGTDLDKLQLYFTDVNFLPITALDYKLSGTLEDQLDWSEITNNAYNFFVVDADTVQSRLGGILPLRITTSRIQTCAFPAPTGAEYIQIRTYDNGTNQPFLRITYTPSVAETQQTAIGITGGSIGDASNKRMGRTGQ